MIDGFDNLFEAPPETAPNSNDIDDDPGKAFVREISSITPQEIEAASNNRSATATELANKFPEQNRQQMEKAFNVALYLQTRIEKGAKVPAGDIATAITSFLYGVWSAYNQGAEIPDENYLVLREQVNQLIANNPALSKGLQSTDQAQRQKVYEYLSMFGNWMIMLQDVFKKNPDPNTVKGIQAMAKEALLASFKIDIERLRISQEGKLSLL